MAGNFWIYTGVLLGILIICWPVPQVPESWFTEYH